jgi:hypothetical protein
MQVTGLQVVSSGARTREVFSISQIFDGEKLKPDFEKVLIDSLEQVFQTSVPLTLRPVIDWTEDFDDMWDKIGLREGVEIMTLLRDGKKVSAIKLVRQQTGVGLKEGKRFVDSKWLWNIMSDLGMTYKAWKEVV